MTQTERVQKGRSRFTGFDYDVVIVGARVSGIAAAIQLHRLGLKILVVDLAFFPSDKMSTHLLLPGGTNVMRRLGAMDRLLEAGGSLYTQDRFVTKWFNFIGSASDADRNPHHGICMTRYTMDKVMVDFARDEGIEVIEGFRVLNLVIEQDCVRGVEGEFRVGREKRRFTAPLVLGADGLRSSCVRLGQQHLGAFEIQDDIACLRTCFYMVTPNIQLPALKETSILGGGINGYLIVTVENALTMLCIAFHPDEMDDFRKDRYGHFLRLLEAFPVTAPIVGMAEREIRESKMWGTYVMRNTVRDPIANGMVLIGDAGITIDPIVGQGMSFALIGTELLAQEAEKWFDESSLDAFSADSLESFRVRRDERLMPVYNFTRSVSIDDEGLPEEFMKVGKAAETDSRLADELLGWISMLIPPDRFPSEHMFKAMMKAYIDTRPRLQKWDGRRENRA